MFIYTCIHNGKMVNVLMIKNIVLILGMCIVISVYINNWIKECVVQANSEISHKWILFTQQQL